MSARTLRAGPAWLLLVGALAVLPLACRPNDDLTAPAPGTVLVDIQMGGFQPETVTVAPGRSVRWTNRTNLTHTVVATGGEFQSQFISPTFWFEAVFPNAGTFEYRCGLHVDEMLGAVIAQ